MRVPHRLTISLSESLLSTSRGGGLRGACLHWANLVSSLKFKGQTQRLVAFSYRARWSTICMAYSACQGWYMLSSSRRNHEITSDFGLARGSNKRDSSTCILSKARKLAKELGRDHRLRFCSKRHAFHSLVSGRRVAGASVGSPDAS